MEITIFFQQLFSVVYGRPFVLLQTKIIFGSIQTVYSYYNHLRMFLGAIKNLQ